ncbi:MAG: hypothetical protein HYU97_11160 [Deltaproteobacteria bacterium]|nr:hypothetical protein [Deltaproteobacteria bacterium]
MSPKIKICKEEGCSNQQTTRGYCRLHYLKNWRKIREAKQKKSAKDLNRFIDSVMRKNPDKGIVGLKEELKDEAQLEQTVENYLYEDDLNSALEGLGYKNDIDFIIDNIKIDENF